MASSSSSSWTLLAVLISFFLLSVTAGTAGFARGPLKRTHLHFFFQDVLSGSSPTAVPIASAPSSTTNTSVPLVGRFGTLTMFDDPLTEEEDPSSKLIGRAQGTYGVASMTDLTLLITMNLAFTHGEFNGSSIAVVGRNQVPAPVREMPVVGGTGKFRWATGYVLVKTRRLDLATGDATLEYDVYVVHRGSS